MQITGPRENCTPIFRRRRLLSRAGHERYIYVQGVCVLDLQRRLYDLRKAGIALLSLVKNLGIESALGLYSIREHWEQVFREPLSLHSSPSSLRNGKLTVNVDSPAWLQQMNFLRTDLLGKLSPFGVTEIRLRLGKVRKKRAAPKDTKEFPSREDLSYIEDTVSRIQDSALRHSIRHAMKQWAIRQDKVVHNEKPDLHGDN
jgi:hypothetical protein